MNMIDVIVPVYRGLEETKECIESALRTLPSGASQLVVINDCSPEIEVTEYLRARAKTGGFQLLENAENLGFVATVNKGMSLNPLHDVLLLNSDVEVENDWLERIAVAAYSEPNIGSVTPFSNNATICSFPNFCEDNALFNGLSVKKLDAICASSNPEGSVVDIPTGVGFCMFIRRDCLNKVGLFDVDTFGKGYGEENDWCQRAIKAGWRNVHLMNVFVYHKGGVSFADEQDPRKDRALELLNGLHPNYQGDVHAFINKDPAKPYRLKFLLSLLANDQRPKILSIDHGLGGGVVQHVEELAAHVESRAITLRLYPCSEGVVKLSFSLTEHIKDSLEFNIASQYDDLLLLCRYLGVGFVHFHHVMGLPTRLWAIAADLDCEYDVTVHDYYFINGNPTLTDKHGVYCEDRASRDERCIEHYPIPVSAETWRGNQVGLLVGASRVIFPSYDTRNRFLRDFALDNTVVAWHPDSKNSTQHPAPLFGFGSQSKRKLRVLVLGAISREKGADVLEQVADSLNGRSVEFHLLGYAYRPLSSNVTTHGPYLLDELDAKIAAINPDVMWFPAQWPETYSYTLSTALEKGFPVVVPNIGAFSERVAGRAFSAVKNWDMSVNGWKSFWLNVAAEGAIETSNLQAEGCSCLFYDDRYIKGNWSRKSDETVSIETLCLWLDVVTSNNLCRRERVLKRLWKIREHSIFGKFSALIPFKMQRYIKRKLSQKPIHEILK
ncbi:glycosyltransferase [Alkalimarinus alittae]|uniref:Glycosyltransferase n=1 Tax=Alkalimarinus alittae TaxID=2961619 RepID=A0ABY6MZ54_9ALTE|nr:glycosyltransferase [Alkalimarinus alittae]UZE95127.1 glycosyltransferase [Alkalimarinus alittae]